MENIDFAFGVLVGFAALPVFWVAFLVVAGLMWASVVQERGGFATILTIAFGALLVARFPTLLEFFSNPIVLVAAVPAHFLIGVIWARFKWSRFITKAFDNIVERRERFLANRQLPADYLKVNDFDAAHVIVNETTSSKSQRKAFGVEGESSKYTTEQIQAAVALVTNHTEYLEHMKYVCSKDSMNRTGKITTIEQLNSCLVPLAASNKGSIVLWIAYWPISAVWYVIADLVADAATALYKMVGGKFQQMSDEQFKAL